MKTHILLIICFLTFGTTLAQGGNMRERIRAQKVAFITDQMKLSAEEAQQFWPVFNSYESKVERIKNGELRTIRMSLRNSDNMSDEEANDLLARMIQAENSLHTMRLDLVSDLKEVLSPQKILRLKVANEEFNRRLLERLKDIREKRSGRN